MDHHNRPGREEQTPTTHSLDAQQYRVLADEQRRCVLDVVTQQETPDTLGELADAVHERLEDTDATSEEIVIALHHAHLPLMDDAGVLDYDASHRQIEASDDSWPTP